MSRGEGADGDDLRALELAHQQSEQGVTAPRAAQGQAGRRGSPGPLLWLWHLAPATPRLRAAARLGAKPGAHQPCSLETARLSTDASSSSANPSEKTHRPNVPRALRSDETLIPRSRLERTETRTQIRVAGGLLLAVPENKTWEQLKCPKMPTWLKLCDETLRD